MTEICCKTTEALPCCEKVEVWEGYNDDEIAKKLNLNLDAQGRDEQGRYVEIRRIPRSKPCGEKVTRYNVDPRSCCEEAEPVVWNAESTPDVLPHGETIWMYADGGIPPYRFSVTSHGLFFDDGRRTYETLWPIVRLHAGETFCGSAVVKVSDGCSEATTFVRSDIGQWLAVDTPYYRHGYCPATAKYVGGLGGGPASSFGFGCNTYEPIIYSGMYKIQENIRMCSMQQSDPTLTDYCLSGETRAQQYSDASPLPSTGYGPSGYLVLPTCIQFDNSNYEPAYPDGYYSAFRGWCPNGPTGGYLKNSIFVGIGPDYVYISQNNGVRAWKWSC